jgi:hypothetical protein
MSCTFHLEQVLLLLLLLLLPIKVHHVQYLRDASGTLHHCIPRRRLLRNQL